MKSSRGDFLLFCLCLGVVATTNTAPVDAAFSLSTSPRLVRRPARLIVDNDHKRHNSQYCQVYSASKIYLPSSSSSSSPVINRRLSLLRSSTSSSSSDGVNQVQGDDDASFGILITSSIAVAIITAAMGFVYDQILVATQHALWKTIPAVLLVKDFGVTLNPFFFIPGMLTTGGFLVGLLSLLSNSKNFNNIFSVADFVSAFSAVPAQADKMLPLSSRYSLLPLLLISLVTSAFGFSLGPEVTMVYAGGLVGVSLSRQWFGKGNVNQTKTTTAETTLAYAGAAGALTSFIGFPIAGSMFALEMTRSSSAGLASDGGASRGALSLVTVAAASVAVGLVLLRAFLMPNNVVMGGHYSYGAVGDISGRAIMSTALLSSVIGAGLGTVFHKAVSFLKKLLWPEAPKVSNSDGSSSSTKEVKPSWMRIVAVKTMIGLLVGILSVYYPQTLFSGQGSLQMVVDGQRTTMMAITKHHGMIPSILTAAARVNPSLPFTTMGALQVGIAKLVSITLACAGKFPGGIIFPLFFVAAPFAHACANLVADPTTVMPVLVFCTMAATHASVTRRPLATALILSLSATASTSLRVMLPACLVASYVSMYISQLISKNTFFT